MQRFRFGLRFRVGHRLFDFFRRGTGFVGTDLLRDEAGYVTIDRWTSKTDYERFRSAREEEYAALDEKLAELTEAEEKLGEYESV